MVFYFMRNLSCLWLEELGLYKKLLFMININLNREGF